MCLKKITKRLLLIDNPKNYQKTLLKLLLFYFSNELQENTSDRIEVIEHYKAINNYLTKINQLENFKN